MNILIVDDKLENRYLLDTLLKGNGFQVTLADNGLEALKKLKTKKFELIISDILMPEMDGYQFCLECKKNRKLNRIPFVFYTATYTDQKDEEFALRLGADKFIRKPVEPDKFVDIIREVIRDTETGKKIHRKASLKPEVEVLKNYSQRLVEKLEKKMLDLEKSEHKYHALCDNVSDFIFSLDGEDRFDMFNNRIEIWDYTQEDIKGKHFTDILTPASGDIFQKSIHQFKESNTAIQQQFELEFINKNGSISIGEVSISSCFDDQKYLGLFGVVRDMTKHLQQEKEYKQLIDGMNDTVFVIDFESKFIEVNKSAVEILGYTREELLTLGPIDIDPHLSADDIKKLINGMKSDDLQVFETKHRKKDGSIIPIEISSSLVTYQGKKVILSVARDNTKRFFAEEELRKYREHLEELVKERTNELEEKNKQLMEFNKLFIGREFRIKELRDKVKELEEKLSNAGIRLN